MSRVSSLVGLAVGALALLARVAPADAQRPAAPRHTIGLARDAKLAALLADVSPARLRATDSTLVAFGTRNTFSDTTSATRGIGAARRWIHAQLDAISRSCGSCLRVEYDPAMVQVTRHPQRPTVNVVNVLAWLPGHDTTRVVVMGGHYDSCLCSVRGADGLSGSFDGTSDAPGADDDGSGTSAVLEMARVFAARYPKGLEATVVFAAYAAEEQGLLGSTHLAERLHAEGRTVVAAFTDDIVGNTVADDDTRDARSVRIFSSDDADNAKSRELARYAWAVSELYQPAFEVIPVFRLDRIGRGGDHSPFVRHGDAGLRFTERLENYKRQHLPTDDLAHVDFGYVAKVARLNAATVGALASAPGLPDSARARRDAASGGQRWQLSWKAVPNAVRYEVVVRRTTEPTWTTVIPVGTETTHLLHDQLDDVWAGVRAVGANGHRSLVAVVPAPAPPPPARTVAP